jgi:hypothetical protein
MQSSVLLEQLDRPTTTMDGRSADSGDVVAAGELFVHGSPTPVYAIRRRRPKRSSITRALAMKLWWYFGTRFWPCAEPDDEW